MDRLWINLKTILLTLSLLAGTALASSFAYSQTFYDDLESNPTDSYEVIRKNYRRIAIQNHPDQNKNNPVAEKKFKNASIAWAVIGDGEKRSRYDALLRLGADQISEEQRRKQASANEMDPFAEMRARAEAIRREMNEKIFGKPRYLDKKIQRGPFVYLRSIEAETGRVFEDYYVEDSNNPNYPFLLLHMRKIDGIFTRGAHLFLTLGTGVASAFIVYSAAKLAPFDSSGVEALIGLDNVVDLLVIMGLNFASLNLQLFNSDKRKEMLHFIREVPWSIKNPMTIYRKIKWNFLNYMTHSILKRPVATVFGISLVTSIPYCFLTMDTLPGLSEVPAPK